MASKRSPLDPADTAPFFINLAAIGVIVLSLATLNWIYPGDVKQYQWLPFSMFVSTASGVWIAKYRSGSSWVKYFIMGVTLAGASGFFGTIYLYIVGVIKDFNEYYKQSSVNAVYFMLAVTQSFMVGGLAVDRYVDPDAGMPWYRRVTRWLARPFARLGRKKDNRGNWEKWAPIIAAAITTTGVIVSAIVSALAKIYGPK